MKINWKVRLKSAAFWVATIPIVISFVYALLSILGVVPSVTEDVVQNLFVMLVTLLAEFGVIVDPTTKGVSDSDRAMKYTVPGGNENVDV